MPHQRTLIRGAVVAQLLGATAAGARVYPTRILPLRRIELPAISVYTLEEAVTAASLSTAPRELSRELPVMIEGWVAPGDNVDDAMDALALDIENAMHVDPYLADTAAESILDSTVMEVVEDGDRMMGLVVLTYAVTYRSLAPEAPTDLDDFLSVKATHNLGGQVHEDDDAEDEFVVQEVA
jgi:hypothetical protein